MPILADIQTLDPGGRVRLFELDCTAIGGDLMRVHAHPLDGAIVWAGNEYTPWAIEATDMERTGDVQQPAPTLTVGNIGKDINGNPVPGVVSSMCLALQDLVGAKVTVRETLTKYLDSVNFAGGNDWADPTQEFPPEIWTIEQKTSETAEVVTFELANSLSFGGMQLPMRQVLAGPCWWLRCGGYRGPYCGYTGSAYFDVNDNPVSDPAQDKCAGLVSSCKLRFAAQQGTTPDGAVINYGGEPAADRLGGSV